MAPVSKGHTLWWRTIPAALLLLEGTIHLLIAFLVYGTLLGNYAHADTGAMLLG